MLLENSLKNRKALLFILIVFLFVGIFIYLYSPVIFQEGNPWPQVKGIVQLIFGRADIIKLSGSENKYITKSQNGQEVIKDFIKDKGFEFTEQMGSGFLFKSPAGAGAIVTHKYYSRYYSLWSIAENAENKQNSLVEELKDCLPKSDIASHEKCTELLKQITGYDSCVETGFSIMKSNPSQCATPDGRVFIQGD